MNISAVLIDWFSRHKRDLPWRNTTDPYLVWVSEIILQQTRVVQGVDYFSRFIHAFPSVHDLANASLDSVLKLWQGLGYYSRARNMHEAAKYVSEQLNGKFPDNYKDLRKLKGVGDYTAAAIASICFNEPVPVVDGNVFRVLARLFAISDPIDKVSTRNIFKETASEIMDKRVASLFNQAIMEFGAIHCTPVNPDCSRCIFKDICRAYEKNEINKYPVKNKKIKIKNRYLYYMVIENNKSVFLKKRTGNDIWKGLYEFPLIEKSTDLLPEEFTKSREFTTLMNKTLFKIHHISELYVHQLSHQKLHARFIHIKLTSNYRSFSDKFETISLEQLDKYAIPRLIERYIKSQYFQIKINNN